MVKNYLDFREIYKELFETHQLSIFAAQILEFAFSYYPILYPMELPNILLEF